MVAKPIKGSFHIRNVGFHCSGITVSLHKNIHQPYHTTEVFEYSDEETDVYQTSKGVLKMIDEYLDALRETGVYDVSTPSWIPHK